MTSFLDEDVNFLKLTSGLLLAELQVQNVMNSRDMRFVITPKLKCDFHLEYKKALEEFNSVQTSLKRDTSEEKKAVLIQKAESFEKRKDKAFARARKEKDSNKELLTSFFGKEISYGMEVQIMHFDSEMFLNSKNECASTESFGYKLELADFFCSTMTFQFLPRFKSRNIGDKVQYGDSLYVQNVSTLKKLCVSDTQFEEAVDLSADQANPFL